MRIYFFTAPLAYSDFPGGSKAACTSSLLVRAIKNLLI